jgi:hypothetical protein
VKLRIRIRGLDAASLQALDRKARLFLGRHAQSIESVEISLTPRGDHAASHECEVAVSMRDGGAIRVLNDGGHVHRALLRAAWRIDQRRELTRLRGEEAPAARGSC